MAQKKKPTEDLRVLRTRKALTQAMIDLTIEHGFAALTVQDIVDRALVNRATFYRHYLDKQDLLAKYMDDVYALTAPHDDVASATTRQTDGNAPPPGLVTMLEHVQAHAAFYRAILGPRGDVTIVQHLQRYIERRLRSLAPPMRASQEPPAAFWLSYVSHASVGALRWWLLEGQSYSAEHLAAWLTQLNRVTFEHTMGAGAVPEA